MLELARAVYLYMVERAVDVCHRAGGGDGGLSRSYKSFVGKH